MKQIMDSRQEMINDCGNGLIALFTNEQEVTVKERVQTGIDTFEDKDVTKYQYEFNELKVSGPATQENILPVAIRKVKDAISVYDSSDAVNSFTIDGKAIWLNKDTRLALRQRFVAEQASGIKNTTLWYGTDQFNLSVSDAIEMLNAIEIYACKCYDVTAAHKAMVQSMTTLDDVFGYDYTTASPENPSFTTTTPAPATK